MARTAPTCSWRRGAVAAVGCAALVLPVAAAGPAAAQTAGGTALSGAARGSAVGLTLNLPQGMAVQLLLDPVAGTVRAVPGAGPESQAAAALLTGSIGEESMSLGEAQAALPEPLTAEGPSGPLNAGLAGSPLAEFLSLDLLSATAAVTPDPTSTSRTQIAGIGIGLPAALVEGLTPALDPLREAVGMLITELAGGIDEVTLATFCGNDAPLQSEELDTAVGTITGGLGGVPTVGPPVAEVLEEIAGGAFEGSPAVLCELSEDLASLNDALQASLGSLIGPGGLFGTGLIGAEQRIVRDGSKVTSTATASIADLTFLGTSPFATAEALNSTSTASIDGSTAVATVDKTAVEAVANTVDPLAAVRTDLETLQGEIAGVDLQGVGTLVAELDALLDMALGIGIDAGPLGTAQDAIAACPQALDGGLSGIFQAPDGSCAAAASRGFGLAISLPEQLAMPLGVVGPLVELTITPTAAVAQSSPVAAAPAAPAPVPPNLPRTGAEAPLAALGAALLLGGVALRRRRTAG